MVLSDQIAESIVTDVIWEASKNGYLKPRVRIEPIHLGGVKIEYATGFNGKFIEDNNIGIGALIEIIRSGDVIPYIKSVSVPAEKAKMPDQPYIWTDTHVDVILENANNDPTVILKNISGFFITIGVDGLAKGNIKRIIEAGYDSIPKIIHMSKYDFEKVGFKTLSNKFVEGIHKKLEDASLINIMSASNKLGRGISEKTIELIMKSEPNILLSKDSNENKMEKLMNVKGIGKINATTFVENIPEFLKFLHDCDLDHKLFKNEMKNEMKNEIENHNSKDNTHILFDKKIVMTKIRDKEIIEKVKEFGGIIEDSIKSDTFALIVKSKDDNSNKMEKAKDKNIPIFTVEEFKNKYM
jgi:NAD-dependent DNA ligase